MDQRTERRKQGFSIGTRWAIVASAVVALLAFGCGPPPAAPVESTDESTSQFTSVEPEIPIPQTLDDLMTEIVKIYVDAPTWNISATSTWSPPTAFARPAVRAAWRLNYARPSKLRLETTLPPATTPRSVLVSDGEFRTLYLSSLERYSIATAPASLAAALDDRQWVLIDGTSRRLIAPFLEQTAWDDYWAKATKKEGIELKLIDGVEQFVARWTISGTQWTAHILAKEPKRIVRLDAYTPAVNLANREATGDLIVETYEYLDAAPADPFTFVPPPAATLIADFALSHAGPEDELRPTVGRPLADVPVIAANAPAGAAPTSLATLTKGARVGKSMVRRPTVVLAVDLKNPETTKLLGLWNEIASQFRSKNLGLMVVCEGSAPADALAAARKAGLPADSVYSDGASGLSQSLPTRGLPVTLIVDRYGIVRRTLLGCPPSWSDSATVGIAALIEQEEDAARFQAQLSAVAPPQELVRALGHIDPLVQQTAAKKLREMKDDGIPVLTVGSTSHEVQVRLLTLALLGELAPKRPDLAPVLTAKFNDVNAEVRAQARKGLVRMGTPAIPLLQASLASPDVRTRREAANALGSMRYRAFGVIPDLAVSLGDPDPGVRKAASDALVRLGRKSLPALRDSLASSSAVRQEAAAKTLVRYGSLGANALVQALQHPPESLIATAAKIGPSFAAPDAARIQEALRVYETAKTLKDQPTADLIPLLGDAQPALASAAADVLAQRGEAAVPNLSDMLSSDKRQVRRLAAEALGRIGPAAYPAWDYLRVALKDSAPEVRLAAAEAAGRIGPAVLEPLAAELMGASDPKVKAGVMRALSQMGGAAAGVKGTFAAALSDQNEDVRNAAAEALAALGAEGLPALLAGLDNEDSDVQVAAVKGLARLGGDAVEALTTRLGDSKARTRVWAAVALGDIGVEAQPAVAVLKALANDPDRDVRLHAKEAEDKIAQARAAAQDEEPATATESPLPAEPLAPDAPAGTPASDGAAPAPTTETTSTP